MLWNDENSIIEGCSYFCSILCMCFKQIRRTPCSSCFLGRPTVRGSSLIGSTIFSSRAGFFAGGSTSSSWEASSSSDSGLGLLGVSCNARQNFFNLENDLTPKQSSKHYTNWKFYIKINIIKHYLNRGLCMSALFFLSLLLLFLLFVLVFFLSWCAGCVMKWTINFSADLQFKTYSTSMYFLLWWWLII